MISAYSRWLYDIYLEAGGQLLDAEEAIKSGDAAVQLSIPAIAMNYQNF